MIRVEWSKDAETAHRIMVADNVWPHISDDTCDKNTFQLPEIDGAFVRLALCYYDDQLYGCFYLIEVDDITIEIHTCMLLAGKAKIFGDQIVKMVFNETDYEKISTFIPIDNPAARKLAERCGFVLTGLREPITKSGISTPVETWERLKCHQL